MQRALSAENLAEIAHGAIKGLRRLVSPGSVAGSAAGSDTSPSLSDFLSTVKVLEDSQKRALKIDPSVMELNISSLGLELEFLLSVGTAADAPTPTSSSSTSSTSLSSVPPQVSPLTPSSSVFPSRPAGGVKGASLRQCLTDAQLLQGMDGIKVLMRKFPPHLVSGSLVEHRIFERLLLLLTSAAHGALARTLQPRVLHAIFSSSVQHLSESLDLFLGTVEVFGRLLLATPPLHSLCAAQQQHQLQDDMPPIRVMVLLFHALRRADTINVSHANEVKCRLHQAGVLSRMCETAITMAERHKSGSEESASIVLTCGVLALATAGAICRSNMPHKLELRSNKQLLSAWVYLSSNVGRVDVGLTVSMASDKLKADEMPWAVETSTIWAAELAELVLELSTSGSFSLQRQAKSFDRMTASPPITPPNQAARPPVAPVAASAPDRPVRRWEALPADWDSTLAGSGTSVWDLSAQVATCLLTSDSAALLADLLPLIDASSEQTEFIYRAIISSLVLLCQANPTNIVMLQQAGMFSTLISLLTDPSASTFALDSKLTPAFLMRLGDASWHLTMGLLTVLASTHFTKNDLQLLMSAVDAMKKCETTAEDCEIIEQLLHVAGRSRFARDMLWFSGVESAVSCSVEKFAGRWYGYSFAAWINPSCVWSDGCRIFSFFETSSSMSVTLAIVANGRTKSLAVRTVSIKELTIAVLPDTSVPDGWCHLAFVHNIAGFTVYINGRKSSCSPSVPFPKEPSKQNKLIVSFGGEAALPSLLARPQPKAMIPSFFGTICGPMVLDGALNERDVERMSSVLPGHPIEGPPLSVPVMLGVHVGPAAATTAGDAATPSSGARVACPVDVIGPAVKKENCVVQNVDGYVVADTAQAFADLAVLDWAVKSLEEVGDCPNRNIIAVLLLEFLNVYVKIGKDGVLHLAERNVIARIRAILVTWDNVPPQIYVSLLSVAIAKLHQKKLRAHPSTSQILTLAIDLINVSSCSAATKSGVLKELSDLLSEPDNVKLFRDGARFESVLALGRSIPVECVDDLVMLTEKLCKEPHEMELLLKFVLFEPKSVVVVKIELLRMLYDVSKSTQSVCETIGNVLSCNGIVALLSLIHGGSHQSEVLRIYAIRLLALVLHCSRRHRDQFNRINGYDLLMAALVAPCARSAGGPPVRLATFNCLFKFALGFFQPSSALDSVNTSVITKAPSASAGNASAAATGMKRTSPSGSTHSDPHFGVGGSIGFHGHLPSLVPSNSQGGRRVFSVDLSSADCGDVESRLSVDDNYNSQAIQRDTLVYPQLVCVVLALLGRVLAQQPSNTPSLSDGGAAEEPQPPASGAANNLVEVISSASNISTARRDEDSADVIAMKVLLYLDRMVDLVPNSLELLPHPWLEWVWGCVEPVLAQPPPVSPQATSITANAAAPVPPATVPGIGPTIESVVRSFVRKMAVVDLSRGPKQSYLRRVKDLCDAPQLQRIVLEEVVRHFSMNNRLDTMEAGDAQNVIRNVDVLLQEAYDVLSPFPAVLSMEIVHAVGAIALYNNQWVRQKMKQQSKLFESRDRLAFATLVSTVKDFSKQSPSFLQELLDANLQDPNAAIVLLRALVDGVRDRQIDEVEALQVMIRRAFAVDEEQRRAIVRVVGDSDVQDLIISQRRVLQGSEVPMPDMISWCMSNDARWEQVAQRILRAAKPIETETASRLERREKERAARGKSRRVEVERKQAATAKNNSDLDKLRQEVVDSRAAGYKDSDGKEQ